MYKYEVRDELIGCERFFFLTNDQGEEPILILETKIDGGEDTQISPRRPWSTGMNLPSEYQP